METIIIGQGYNIEGDSYVGKELVKQFETQSLMQDLRHIIEQARSHVAATANYEQTMMYRRQRGTD